MNGKTSVEHVLTFEATKGSVSIEVLAQSQGGNLHIFRQIFCHCEATCALCFDRDLETPEGFGPDVEAVADTPEARERLRREVARLSAVWGSTRFVEAA